MDTQEHYCDSTETFPITKFLQVGTQKGSRILILGEAPAPNGWRKSGKAFYTPNGRLLPTGKNLNKLLEKYFLTVEVCGFTELVKCYPGKDRKLLVPCGEKCWAIFIKQLQSLNIKVIIILGIKTLEIFNKQANTSLKVGELSQVTLENKVYWILPIYHPSPIGPFNHKNNIEIFNKLENQLKKIL